MRMAPKSSLVGVISRDRAVKGEPHRLGLFYASLPFFHTSCRCVRFMATLMALRKDESGRSDDFGDEIILAFSALSVRLSAVSQKTPEKQNTPTSPALG